MQNNLSMIRKDLGLSIADIELDLSLMHGEDLSHEDRLYRAGLIEEGKRLAKRLERMERHECK